MQRQYSMSPSQTSTIVGQYKVSTFLSNKRVYLCVCISPIVQCFKVTNFLQVIDPTTLQSTYILSFIELLPTL